MAHKLKHVRESLGLTVQELHELSGICVSTIYRIEREDPTFKIQDKTAKALSCALYKELLEIFNPVELSPLGRPALSGVPCTPADIKPPSKICPDCRLTLPATGICDDCGELPKTG